MKLVRIAIVLVVAAMAFAVAAALIAANARPEPGPCNDTGVIELPVDDRGVGRREPAICAAPEAPAWLVLGGGTVAAAGVVAGYMLLVRRPRLRDARR